MVPASRNVYKCQASVPAVHVLYVYSTVRTLHCTAVQYMYITAVNSFYSKSQALEARFLDIPYVYCTSTTVLNEN